MATVTMETIPINEIVVDPRMRGDLGDLDGLKDSIRRHGLLQPILLTRDKHLVDGERRYRAHQQLGLERIRFVFSDEATPDILAEWEFETNYWRKSMSWQEEALGMLDIYRKKKLQGALEAWQINYQRTIAEMFAMSIGTVNYILAVAQRLEKEKSLPDDKRQYWKYASANEAYRLGLLAEKQDAANKLLADYARQRANHASEETHAKQLINHVELVSSTPQLLSDERTRYESNPLNTVPFDQYWQERQAQADAAKNTIYISNKFVHGSCIDYMTLDENVERFDHIITDPPYGIDMDHLNQSNQHGGLVDLNRVVDAHQVDENEDLLAQFFPAAFRCTKPSAFVVLFCDAMQWQYLYDLATEAGFAVQRWPLIWRKVNQSIMNNCPGYNTTKDYELIMLCRKPSVVFQQKRNSSFVDGSNNEVTKLFGHPFGKPFEVTKVLVDLVSLPGQTILEPFAGGGSLVVQMLRMNRNVIAIEKEERWFNQILTNVKTQHYLKLNPKFIFK